MTKENDFLENKKFESPMAKAVKKKDKKKVIV